MSLLSRVSGAGGGGEEKACTSPIESHFDSRLIYFLLPLVRMQMRRRAAPCRAVPNFFQRGPAVPGPGASLSLSLSLPLSLSPCLSTSHQYSSHLSRTDCPGSVMAQSTEPSNEKPRRPT